MNEAETRSELIDPALAAAGWNVVEGSRIRREYPITLGRLEGAGRRGKPLTADYVLEYRNTKLAVVEAKAWDKELTEGVGQAKDYAAKLAVRFTYATNGQGIYGIDMQTGHEAELSAYPSPDELWNLTFATANAWRDRFIDAENSDLFDVLAHIAYALEPLTREERAARAAALVGTRFNDRQRAFLDFVLSHYVSSGVEELDQTKLTPLLKLKYHDSIADAVADLGKPEDIGRVFAGFQKYLYQTDTTP